MRFNGFLDVLWYSCICFVWMLLDRILGLFMTFSIFDVFGFKKILLV
jgi:hypothetical protein